MVRIHRRGFDPFAQFIGQLGQVDRQLGQFWDELPARASRALQGRAYPAVNVWDDGEALIAEAELPGLSHENLEITVVGEELTIKGSRAEVADEGKSFHRRERISGEFTRVLHLPTQVEAEHVEATLHDGVLTIRMPKAEAAKPRKISVQNK